MFDRMEEFESMAVKEQEKRVCCTSYFLALLLVRCDVLETCVDLDEALLEVTGSLAIPSSTFIVQSYLRCCLNLEHLAQHSILYSAPFIYRTFAFDLFIDLFE